MNPDNSQSPRQELEARLTALLLGELSDEEAASLRRIIEQDADLTRLYERLKQTIALAREATTNPTEQTAAQPAPLRLSGERRQKLLAHFKTVAPREFVQTRRRGVPWFVPMSAAAVMVAMIGATLLAPQSVSRRERLSAGSDYLKRGQVKSGAGDDYSYAIDAAGQPATVTPPVTIVTSSELRAFYDADGEKNVPATPIPTTKEKLAVAKFRVGAKGGPSQAEAWQDRLAKEPGVTALTDSQSVEEGRSVAATRRREIVLPWGAEPAGSANQGGGLAGGGGSGGRAPDQGLFEVARSHAVNGSFDGLGDTLARREQSPQPAKGSEEAKTPLAATPPPVSFEARLADTIERGSEALSLERSERNAPAGNGRIDAQGGAALSFAEGAPPATPVPAKPTAETAVALRESERIAAFANSDATPGARTENLFALGDLAVPGAQPRPDATTADAPHYYDRLMTERYGLLPNAPPPPAAGEAKAAAPTEYKLAPSSTSVRQTAGKDLSTWAADQSGVVVANGLVPGLEQTPVQEVPQKMDLAYDVNRGLEQGAARGRQAAGASVDAADYFKPSAQPANPAVVAAEEPARRKSSPIALPQVTSYAGVGNAELIQEDKQLLRMDKPSDAEAKLNASNADAFYSVTPVEDTKSSGARHEAPSKAKSVSTANAVSPDSTSRKPAKVVAAQVSDYTKSPEPRGDRKSSDATIAGPELEIEQLNKEIAGRSPLRLDPEVAKRAGDALSLLAVQEKVDATVPKESAQQSKQIASVRLDQERLEDGRKTQLADEDPPVAPRKPAPNAPIPQPEIQTHDNAWSTFSLNVSDVSFKLAAASLEKGAMPEPATVRSEEFINAFDYRDPEPSPGVPIAFAWERTRYPFAHNRDLLRFSVKTAAAGRQPGRPLNLVLLLDNSGSMERADRVRIIHESLRVLAAQLQPQDKISVITFARTARLWMDGVPGNQAGDVSEQVGGLTPQGGTNLEEAMNLAYQTALRHYLATGINRVVLLTDGAANLGNVDPESLKQKVEAHRKQGIALDCFGVGWEGFNDDLLEVLSRNGDGRYGFINTAEEAATEFAGQLAGALRVAASDVKVQVEFNPARVTAYRQIGYAKHQLTKEQFRDNTVDAAEIGAAESGNALYVAEVNSGGEGPLAIVRVRFKIPGTSDYREHEWAVSFTGNAVSLEQASPAMRLAATASAFSEWLVSSPYAAEVTPDQLLGYLGGVPEICGADARPKKLEWMIRQAKSIAGK